MASPSIRSSATTADTNAATTPVTLPGTIVTGDLLLAFDTLDAGTSDPSTTSPGWSRLSAETQGSNVLRFAVFAKIAGASNTLDLVGINQDAAVVCVAIQDHGVTGAFTELVLATAATGTTGNANPPTTGTLAAKDWLILAACGIDMTATGDTLSAAPSGYSTIISIKSAASTSSCATGVAVKALTAGTVDDPGTFTNTSRPWIAKTIAIPPYVAPSALTNQVWGVDFGGLLVPSGYSASDNFDRADGGLGSNWAVCQAAMAISGNKVVIGANPSSMFWNSGSFANNQYSQAAVTMSVTGFYMASVIVRANPANGAEFYFARLCASCGDVAVGKRVAFSQSEFASGGSVPTSVPSTTTLRLEVEGTTLRAYVNSGLVVTTTDVDLASGRPGIHLATANATDASIDNWAGGDL